MTMVALGNAAWTMLYMLSEKSIVTSFTAEFSGRKTAPSGALENANPDDGKQQSGFAETP